MKALRCCFIGTFFLAWLLLLGRVVIASDFDLGIATSKEGTTLGENLNIEVDKTTGVKCLSGLKGGGKLDISVQLSTNFEITVVGNWDSSIKIFLITENGNKTWLWDSYYDEVKAFGTELINLSELDWHSSSAKTKNTVKWFFDEESASLHINDTVAAKITRSNSDVYTQLVVSGIDDADRIYELTGEDESENTDESEGATAPSTTTDPFEVGKQVGIQQCQADPASCGITVTTRSDFELGKQAGIQQCQMDPASCGINVTDRGTDEAHATFNPSTGELYIPFVDVPGAFGVMQVYEVYLLQQWSAFTFDLDMNRLKQIQ